MLSNSSNPLTLLTTDSTKTFTLSASADAGEANVGNESGFLRLLQNLNGESSLAEGEQDVAALIQQIEQKSGEKFPLDELMALMPEDGLSDGFSLETLLDQIPLLDQTATTEALESPEQLSGDDLLSFLMANAGGADKGVDLQALQSRIQTIIESLQKADELSADVSLGQEGMTELVIALADIDAWLKALIDANGSVKLNEPMTSEDSNALAMQQGPLISGGSPLAASVAEVNQTVLSGDPLSSALKPESLSMTEMTKNTIQRSADDTSSLLMSRSDTEQSKAQMALKPDAGLWSDAKKSGLVEEPVIKSPGFLVNGQVQDKEAKAMSQTGENRSNGQIPTADRAMTARLDALFGELSPEERSSLELGATTVRTAVTRGNEASLVPQALADQLAKPMKLQEAAQALTDRIQTMVAGGLQRAVIRLDPPELGALELRVHVQNDQTQVQIVSPSPQVREALEQNSARLREALAQQGLNLTQVDVSDQHRQSGSSGSERDGAEADRGGDANSESELIEDVPVQVSQQGLVDHYV